MTLPRRCCRGKIYFTGVSHLAAIAASVLVVAVLLPRVSPRLLIGRFFPEHFPANGVVNPRHELVFDMLVAMTVALAASVVGVMGAFALAFVPAWVAFRFAHGWRRTVAWSAGLGLVAYLVSFVLAMLLDQPFGPVLVATLLGVSVLRSVVKA